MTAGERWEETDYVITTSIGTPVASTNLRRNFEKFLKANGVRYIRLHDIRHSVIVLALQLGIPIEQVSQVAGHTRIETTKGIYAPYVPRYTTNFATVVSSVFPSARRRAESEADEWNSLKERGESNL
jgi:integrase